MEITLLVMATVCIIGLVICFYFAMRNRRVYGFRLKVIDNVFDKIDKKLWSYKGDEEFTAHYNEYDEYRDKLMKIQQRYTYDEMLYSLKPLKMEKWFTPEELDLLK